MRLLHIIPDYESHASLLSTRTIASTAGTQATPSPFGTASLRTARHTFLKCLPKLFKLTLIICRKWRNCLFNSLQCITPSEVGYRDPDQLSEYNNYAATIAMVQVKSKLGFHVKRVIPETFLESIIVHDVYISIDSTGSEVFPHCTSRMTRWSGLVYGLKGKETVDTSISQAGAESKLRRWEGGQPFAYYFEHPEFFRLEDGWYAIRAIVRIGQKGNSTVHPGSHWALIKVDS